MWNDLVHLFFQILDWVLHLDVYLAAIAAYFGPWVYVILFLVIFAETGLIVTPFLPGDSLLFATGALIALEGSGLNLPLMWVLLVAAAFIGDNVNYSVGSWLSEKVKSRHRSLRFLNPRSIEKTHEFYARHGGKTVFLARFLPILRTFAPFVAGVGKMNRRSFMVYSFCGSVVWMTVFLGAGYSFGQVPWVQKNFSVLIMAMIGVSLLPMLWAVLSQQVKKPQNL